MPPSRVRSRLESVSIGLILFLLLFIFAGLFVIFEGLRTAMRQGLLPGALMVAFGVFFLSIPSGALALLIYGRREARRQAERRAANPDRPWTWRNDFATGTLRPEGGAETGFVTVFSLFWNAAALAGAWAGVREYRQTGDWRFLLVLLFPAVGAAFLYWAFMHTWRRLRYRNSVLRLDTTPVEIGGGLKGTILIPPRLDPAAGFELTLDCLRRTRDLDNDTHDCILWEERTRVAGPVASWPEAGTAIPVSVQIPEECEAWDDAAPDRQVIWRLRVAADVPGANLEQLFEVPVFRTRPEDPARPREPLPEGFIRPSARAIAPASTRALIEGLPEGAEFVFPPGRRAAEHSSLLDRIGRHGGHRLGDLEGGCPVDLSPRGERLRTDSGAGVPLVGGRRGAGSNRCTRSEADLPLARHPQDLEGGAWRGSGSRHLGYGAVQADAELRDSAAAAEHQTTLCSRHARRQRRGRVDRLRTQPPTPELRPHPPSAVS